MSDYISRVAAIDAVKKERYYTGKFTFEEEHGWVVGFQQGITFALSDIAVIPTADVRPVVLGRWEKCVGENGVTSACRCNLCGFEDNRFSMFNYCPNCGAKMKNPEEYE